MRPHRNQERIPTTPSAFDADGRRVRATSILLHFLAVKQVAGPEFAPHAAYAHTDPGTCARNGLQRDGSEVRTPATGSVRATTPKSVHAEVERKKKKNLWARTPEVREAAPGASGADRLRRGA